MCHFINNEFKLIQFLTYMLKLEGSHASTTIANNLQNVFHKWKLENKIITIVTDNTANMKSAVKKNRTKYSKFSIFCTH